MFQGQWKRSSTRNTSCCRSCHFQWRNFLPVHYGLSLSYLTEGGWGRGGGRGGGRQGRGYSSLLQGGYGAVLSLVWFGCGFGD